MLREKHIENAFSFSFGEWDREWEKERVCVCLIVLFYYCYLFRIISKRNRKGKYSEVKFLYNRTQQYNAIKILDVNTHVHTNAYKHT